MNYKEHIDRIVECPNCGVEFIPTNTQYKFCSYECFASFQDTVSDRREQNKYSTFSTEIYIKMILRIHNDYLYDVYRPLTFPKKDWIPYDWDEEIDEFVRLIERDHDYEKLRNHKANQP